MSVFEEVLSASVGAGVRGPVARGTALRSAARVGLAGLAGFARNVCVGLGNWGSREAVPVLMSALSDPEPEPLVRAHAAWALGRVDSSEARQA
jgi:HEAT repeat protein